RLDAAKDEISRLQRDLAAAEARTQALFEQDAQARSAVAEAVKARQVAADLLARRAAFAPDRVTANAAPSSGHTVHTTPMP
ncbi:MAG TPA: hypothetical protein PLK69_11825, partial [Tetrasphaera sp.]|nr:hypothetical protein [Tetrasphaera sp.]